MNSKKNLSILLLIIATTGISFGGLIIRNVNTADAWQVAFYRGLGFVISFILILIYRYKLNFIKSIKNTGYYGFIGGIFLTIANVFFIHSLTSTTIGNSLFTVSSIPFITSILAYFILKEKIKLQTLIIMIFAFSGISLMFKSGIASNDYFGNLLALGCAISFSFFLLILRKSRDLDMMPASLIGGIMIVLVSFIFKKGDIDISFHDILYCIFWGAILNGFMNIVFIFSIKHLFASEVSFFMLLEFCLGPIWVWIFLDELLRLETLIGGLIVMLCVALYSTSQLLKIRSYSKINST